MEARDADGQRPMHAAAARGDTGALVELSAWAAMKDCLDARGRTPLSAAVAAGAPLEVVRYLVQEA